MKLLVSCAISLLVARASSKIRSQHSPVLLWSSNPKLFNNDEVSKKVSMQQVFEMLMKSLDAVQQPESTSTPYLLIHMLPRGIETPTILNSEAQESAPPKVLSADYGSHLFFPNVTKSKDFNLTEEWADLYEKIHIPQHQQDKKRLAILTNRDVQEDDEAYKVVLPESAFVLDQVIERMGDTRILLVEGGALLQSDGNDASHLSIISALIGNTSNDVLLISADIDPPLTKKGGPKKHAKANLRRLQGVITGQNQSDRADGDPVVLRIKPGQLAILFFLGAFIFTVIVAVLCTMQINTPALYLDKAIPINKEF